MRWMSAFLKRVVSLAACSLAALAAAVPLARADSPFPNGFWAAPLAADVALDPGSPAIAANIGAQAAKGAGFAVRQWNARIYRVPVDQPKVLVVVDGTTNAHRVLQAALNADGGVPIPKARCPLRFPPAGRATPIRRCPSISLAGPTAATAGPGGCGSSTGRPHRPRTPRARLRCRGASPHTATPPGTCAGAGASATPAPAPGTRSIAPPRPRRSPCGSPMRASIPLSRTTTGWPPRPRCRWQRAWSPSTTGTGG